MSLHNRDASIETVADELAARLRDGLSSATFGNSD